ncbi:MAG: dipeptidase [Gammaproteobacteria bacterium]|nr:dipeptidase [Gammaproteobacteria bacterium]
MRASFCVLAWLCCGVPSLAQVPADILALHDRVLTLDAHVDIPASFATTASDPGVDGFEPVDLPKMERGGLDAAAFALFTGQGRLDHAGYATALDEARVKAAAIRRMALEMYPDRIGLALSADDVRRHSAAGRRSAIMSMLNAYSLGAEAEHLDEFYAAGVRMVGLTHLGHNQFADSARPSAALGNDATLHGGLSDAGRALVGRLNALGVIIDVSQITEQALLQTAALSSAPVVASHVGVRALVDHPRNLTDRALMAVKESGGVVHIVAFDAYLKQPSPERLEAIFDLLGRNPRETDEQRIAYLKETRQINERLPGASVADLADQVDYVVELLGIDHVGLATDFNHGGGIAGWMDEGDAANVTAELVRRGYSEDEIAKIWGGNFLRVFEAAATRKTR